MILFVFVFLCITTDDDIKTMKIASAHKVQCKKIKNRYKLKHILILQRGSRCLNSSFFRNLLSPFYDRLV